MIARIAAWFGVTKPRRAQTWDVVHTGGPYSEIHEWACRLCKSATGCGPDESTAHTSAATHWRACHSNETSMS